MSARLTNCAGRVHTEMYESSPSPRANSFVFGTNRENREEPGGHQALSNLPLPQGVSCNLTTHLA